MAVFACASETCFRMVLKSVLLLWFRYPALPIYHPGGGEAQILRWRERMVEQQALVSHTPAHDSQSRAYDI